jgi:3'(2'), 5'-bisphosphate nucleotidase
VTLPHATPTPSPAGTAPHAHFLTVALEAVSRAAVLTRFIQRSLRESDRASKGVDDPVTVGDFASQAVVNHVLTSRLGPVAIVGEESAARLRAPGGEALRAATVALARRVWTDATDDDVLSAIDLGAPPPTERDAAAPTTLTASDSHSSVPRAAAPDTFWTLDPIDGTKGFIRGHQYCVALAFVERGRPVVAALACPNLSADFDRPLTDPDPRGQTFLAAASTSTGQPGTLVVLPTNDPAATPRAVQRVPAPAAAPLRFTESFEPTHSSHGVTAKLAQALRESGRAVADPVRIDSQCKYAMVARGQSDIYLRSPKRTYIDKVWDHAPGGLVAACAGCTVTDAHGTPLDFSGGPYLTRNHGTIVAEPTLHQTLLALIPRAL